MFTEFQGMNPKAEYYRLRGDCYLDQEEWDLAISDYKNATKIDGKKPRSPKKRRIQMRKFLMPRKIDEIIEGENISESVFQDNSHAFFSNPYYFYRVKYSEFVQ